MTRRWMGILLAVSLTFNLAFAAGFIAAKVRQVQQTASRQPVDDEVALVKDLALNEDQREQYEALRSSAQDRAQSLLNSIYVTREELWAEMSSEDASPEKIEQIQTRLHELYRESRELNAEHMREFTELLTPAQRGLLAKKLRHHERERHPMSRRLMEKFDTNRDGKLDEQERRRAREEMSDRFHERLKRNPRFLERYDLDGDKQISREEWNAFQDELLKKFDSNGDGRLDDDEKMKAWRGFMDRRRPGHWPHRHDRPGPPRPERHE